MACLVCVGSDDMELDATVSLEERIKRALGAVQEARSRTTSPFDGPSNAYKSGGDAQVWQ